MENDIKQESPEAEAADSEVADSTQMDAEAAAEVSAVPDTPESEDQGAQETPEPAEETAKSEETGQASEATDSEVDGEAGDADAEKPEPAPISKPQPGMNWYVLHTYSGYEKKVKEQLSERLRQSGMSEYVGRILVPEEEVVEIKNGKKRVSKRMFFPGYVMIEMAINEQVWYIVKETPRITGFLGDASLPSPLSEEEVDRIVEQMTSVKDKPRPKHSYNVGEAVRVTDGPFANFSGVLEEVNLDRAKVKVMVSIFGRATPVELEFSQIEKI